MEEHSPRFLWPRFPITRSSICSVRVCVVEKALVYIWLMSLSVFHSSCHDVGQAEVEEAA